MRRATLLTVLTAGLLGLTAAPAMAADAPTNVGAKRCRFNISYTDCISRNATVEYYFVSNGDTSACRFYILLGWGDGTSRTFNIAGRPDGRYLLASHTYAKTGTYAIARYSKVTAGTCATTSTAYRYQLRPAA